ncbi:phosphotransferase enzyme family protein [Brachybacterium sp. YJGR34]|uniref:phosphotransferase enzyme family protein n=1 Tax=Brachybacterium sp. YJGR34 TaxID=2059911 RepID=UPI000E0AC50B|nr:phosphotransferase [Brachybacterium sp. YJGR34]
MESMMSTVAEGFRLGQVEEMVPVAGGFSNDLWHVTTSSGDVAVKVMRAHAGSTGFRDRIETSFAIEQNAFRAGVPCPEPVPTPEGNALLRVDGLWARAHRWVDGSSPRPADHLEDAGELLARIHRVGAPSVRRIVDHPRDAETWAALAGRPGVPGELSEQLLAAAPELAHLGAATAARGPLDAAHADSHGDLDPKNTLLSRGGLLAVDWDAAGPRPITREAVTLALDWSASLEDFRRALTAYTAASGASLPGEPWVLGGWVEALSDWLAFNVEQRADSELGAHEASQACSRLRALASDLDEYVAALDTV